jgi:hypothetical protein
VPAPTREEWAAVLPTNATAEKAITIAAVRDDTSNGQKENTDGAATKLLGSRGSPGATTLNAQHQG